jgi:hypothetical protein
VAEESGLVGARLLEGPAPGPPAGFPVTHARVPLPWWIIEQPVPADNHLAEPHVHVDHQYVAVVDDPTPGRMAVHPFAWYDVNEIAELAMFEDTKVLATMLFSGIGDLVTGRLDAGQVLRPFVATA